MRAAPSYGVRGRQAAAHSGIRQTARTYGKARIGTYARKAGGAITVDSDAERLTSLTETFKAFRRRWQLFNGRRRHITSCRPRRLTQLPVQRREAAPVLGR